MTKQEYLEGLATLTAEYEKINAKRNELVAAYIRDCQPCHNGDIIQITLDNDNLTKYVGVVCSDDFLYDNGEFRPSIARIRGDEVTNKLIHYDGHTPIKEIKVLGKAPTCSDCLWRKIHKKKIYCSITMDYDRALEVTPDTTMCHRGNYVRWEGDIPYKQKIIDRIKK